MARRDVLVGFVCSVENSNCVLGGAPGWRTQITICKVGLHHPLTSAEAAGSAPGARSNNAAAIEVCATAAAAGPVADPAAHAAAAVGTSCAFQGGAQCLKL